MSRLHVLPATCMVICLALAASASANSLSISAKPVKPDGYSEQLITVNAAADQPGYVNISPYDVGTPCPASYEYDNGNHAMRGDDHNNAVPQGSSSTQFKVAFENYTVAHTHLCGYLMTQTGTTVTDVPLKRWGDVAGYNIRTTTYWINGGRGAFRFIAHCSEGTLGFPIDGPCRLTGHVRITISSKLRKKLHLQSRTILEHAFNTLDVRGLRVDWAAKKGFAAKLRKADLGRLPATLTLKSTAPLATTVAGDGNLMDGLNGLPVATYDVHDNGEE